ncbi:FAD-dependent monooxygenase [Streptomyces sp. NPDC006012]|uniref:FAD-dependent monooxygenase n=1 Tax=Streptomyces sp. NPDC006012 TaxID=3364739 RepID=UPI0036B86FC3
MCSAIERFSHGVRRYRSDGLAATTPPASISAARRKSATRLDFSTIGAAHPFMPALGQSVTEQLMEEHASAVGARVLRGEGAVSLTQGPDAVEAVIRAGSSHRTVHARWVVGCDGTRSAVRRAAGAVPMFPEARRGHGVSGCRNFAAVSRPPTCIFTQALRLGGLEL